MIHTQAPDPYRTAWTCEHESQRTLGYDDRNPEIGFVVCYTCDEILAKSTFGNMTRDCYDWIAKIQAGWRPWGEPLHT